MRVCSRSVVRGEGGHPEPGGGDRIGGHRHGHLRDGQLVRGSRSSGRVWSRSAGPVGPACTCADAAAGRCSRRPAALRYYKEANGHSGNPAFRTCWIWPNGASLAGKALDTWRTTWGGEGWWWSRSKRSDLGELTRSWQALRAGRPNPKWRADTGRSFAGVAPRWMAAWPVCVEPWRGAPRSILEAIERCRGTDPAGRTRGSW